MAAMALSASRPHVPSFGLVLQLLHSLTPTYRGHATTLASAFAPQPETKENLVHDFCTVHAGARPVGTPCRVSSQGGSQI